MDGRKQGRPEDELFLRSDTTTAADSTTVAPLRIQKGRDGRSPPPR